ncbi:NAD(P)-binding protein [Ascobolus immersus RN42]|uniref:Probable quinone oxidoreductase n=1 Tax=Ascobolus immersus RN42 TaxID=1160509 RepID=A0A3N4HI42_ASCIM|nr:NAD(P)-binding protein [Ascobolus immersus RN42]
MARAVMFTRTFLSASSTNLTRKVTIGFTLVSRANERALGTTTTTLSRRLSTASAISTPGIRHLSPLCSTPPRLYNPTYIPTISSIPHQKRRLVTSTNTMSTPDLPKVQTAIKYNENGPPSVLHLSTTEPVPTPSPHQVLIKNTFAGLNYIDTYFRTGLYPTPSFPFIPGKEAEGHIISVGSSVPASYNLSPGDRVVYTTANGTYAQYTAADALHVYKVPAGIPEGHAAATLLQGLTAITLVRESADVKKGDWVLIHAAAGGVGVWLVQYLSQKVDARVIATASTQKKLDLAKSLGAEVVVNYVSDDYIKTVKAVTNGAGVRVVLDSVGAKTFDGALEVVARKGTVVSFGNSSGKVPPVEIARLAPKNVKLLRPQLFAYIATREEFETYADELFKWVLEGSVKVFIHKVYPIEEAELSHVDIESRGTVGKLLVKIPQ